MKQKLNKLEKYWVMYDVGNSAFALLVSTIIPIYFKNMATENGVSAADSTAYLSYALHPALYNIQYEGFMEECRRQRKKVHVWTVDEEKYMRLVCAARVDAMITNYPDRGKKIAEEYYMSSNCVASQHSLMRFLRSSVSLPCSSMVCRM